MNDRFDPTGGPASGMRLPDPQYLAETHEVVNVSRELADYNLYLQDAALREAVAREGAAWAQDDLAAFGSLVGSADYLAQGVLANRFGPELETHDRFGNRIDLVTFHPAYHALMKSAIKSKADLLNRIKVSRLYEESESAKKVVGAMEHPLDRIR